jgi:DNA adenine methylase
MGYGGLVGSRRMMYRHNIGMPYSTTGGLKIKRFHAAIDSIPAWRRRLRNVTILNEDVFRILPRIEDDTGTVIYADPPYVTNRIQYEHEFALEDHARLSHALHRFRRARILVSYGVVTH